MVAAGEISAGAAAANTRTNTTTASALAATVVLRKDRRIARLPPEVETSISRARSAPTAHLPQPRDAEELRWLHRKGEEQVRPDVGERQLGVGIRHDTEHVLA